MKDCRIPVCFGNKSELFATKVGKFRGVAVSKNGKKTPILLYDVKYVPGLHCNLLDNQLKLKFKNLEYSFDHKIKSRTGFLFGLKVVTRKGNSMIPYEKGHMFLTHPNKVTTKATMERLKFPLGPVLDEPCKYCAIAKPKQKHVCKTTPRLDLKRGKGWFLDLRHIKWIVLGRKKFWILFINYQTNYCVSKFVQNKDDLESKGLKLFNKLRAMAIQVKMLIMDNAGENKLLKKSLEQE